MLIAAGTLLFFAQRWADWTGLAMMAAAIAWHLVRKRRPL
jgi:hypothetical protein